MFASRLQRQTTGNVIGNSQSRFQARRRSVSARWRAKPAYFGDGCDLGEIVRAKLDFDVVGHYARPDVFKLSVDERASRSVTRESDST